MIKLLEKLFISADGADAAELRRRYGVLCGSLGIALNLLLAAGKLFAGALSGSVAITADAVNNLSDAGSSVVTLAGFRLAGARPDTKHPFGHGRIEYISGLVVSMLIVLMGFEMAKSAVAKILQPEPVEFSLAAVGILLASILVKLYMALYNSRIGRKIGSSAMRATATDSLSDSVATLVALAGMLVFRIFGLMIDGWCGALVALFVLFAGVKSAVETIDPLLGQLPEPEFVASVEEIVLSHSCIIAIHDMVVHDYGPGRVMVSLHAEVDAAGDMLALHDEIDNAERELKEALACEAVIHMDPVVTGDEPTQRMREAVAQQLRDMDPRLSMHDFRMVPGPTHTNLIFDVVVPYEVQLSDAEVCEELQRRIGAFEDNCYAVVTVDKSYVK